MSGLTQGEQNPNKFVDSVISKIAGYENAATNLCLFATEFDNAAWAKGNSNIVANTTVAPNGQTEADRLTSIGAIGSVASNVAIVVNPTDFFIFSYYFKRKINNAIARISIPNGGNSPFAAINTSSGVITDSNGFGSFQVTPLTIQNPITLQEEIWFRVSMTFRAAIAGMQPEIGIVGVGETLEIWGAQLEQTFAATATNQGFITKGTPPTSFIPTGAATATRPANKISGTRFNVAIQSFINSGNWIKPLGHIASLVIVQAGGGGSSGNTVGTQAAGAGGGGSAIKLLLAAAMGATEVVTIGAGGLAGINPGGTGGTGGTTSLGALAVATGGIGSTDTAAGGVGGVGGIGTTGDLLLEGTDGQPGITDATFGVVLVGGAGGNSLLGGGGRGAITGTTGLAGNQFGGGAGAQVGNVNNAGLAGAAGCCIVIDFIQI